MPSMKLSKLCNKLVRHPGSNLSMKLSEDGQRLYKATFFPFANPPRSEWRDVSTQEIRLDELVDDLWYEDKHPIHDMK
jgi:hypothetical protein